MLGVMHVDPQRTLTLRRCRCCPPCKCFWAAAHPLFSFFGFHSESAVLDHVLEHCQLPIGSCSSCDGHPHEATDSKHVEMHADLDRTAKKLHSLSNIVSSRLP